MNTPTQQLETGAAVSAPWDDLVASALLGTEHRTPPPHLAAQGSEAPVALLDAAAVHAVRRRAGLLPAPAAPPPSPAPPDLRKPLPEPAARRLSLLLAGRSASSTAAARGTAPDLGELLPQWLAVANGHGYAAPAVALPALLDAARARTDLRRPVVEFAGPRGLWLALLNPEWRFARRGGAGGFRLPAPDDADAVERLWQEGLFAERLALLSAVRERDAEAARILLTSTWPKERAEDRLMFVDSLRTGLSAEDEPFLESALADRSSNVRSTAAELLTALPGSALAARMAARAVRHLDLAEEAGSPALVVDAPRECDVAMRRDGVVPVPPAGRGERSWWLGQLVEAAPLAVWPQHFGGRTAAEIIGLPVRDDWGDELHASWSRAAVRQQDAEWARALLDAPDAAGASPAESARLLAVLDDEERATRVASYIGSHGVSEAFQLLTACAVPWAEPLGRAVVDALDIARDAGTYPWGFSGVMGLAERCLAPEAASRLEPLVAAQEEREDSSPGADGYWSEAFRRLVSTLRLREAMLAELAPPQARPVAS